MKKGNLTYIQFETGRTYYPEKKYTIPVRVSIGKLDPNHPEMMYPNKKFSDWHLSRLSYAGGTPWSLSELRPPDRNIYCDPKCIERAQASRNARKHLSQDYGTRRSDYYIEALDRKIERLQEKDKEYSVLAEELYTLLDERHPERKIERAKQALYNAYVESERSLDEIIDLIRNVDEWI